MRPPCVIPECFGDNKLLSVLKFETVVINQHNIGQVANIMMKHYSKRLAIGVIDNDKMKPDYFSSRTKVIPVKKINLIYYSFPNPKHHLIILDKDLEDWLSKAAHFVKLPLPMQTKKKLKVMVKNINVGNNPVFSTFLNDLIQRKSPHLLGLQFLIKGLTMGAPIKNLLPLLPK